VGARGLTFGGVGLDFLPFDTLEEPLDSLGPPLPASLKDRNLRWAGVVIARVVCRHLRAIVRGDGAGGVADVVSSGRAAGASGVWGSHPRAAVSLVLR